MEQMYKGMPFSPTATLTTNISATDTIIPVSDVDAFPDAPNIATIGSIAGPNETIIYTGKTTTSLTGCTRGVEGVASDWPLDELIGRNFTAKDHADMVKNIEELESNKLDATYKVDVVNTADVSIAGKALDARQNNPNITGTLAQKVTSNTQQINVLSKDVVHLSYNVNGTIEGIADYDTMITPGVYGGDFYTSNQQHAPFNSPQVTSAKLTVSFLEENVIEQLFEVSDGYMRGTKWRRIYNISTQTFDSWEQITFNNNYPLTLLNGWVNSTWQDLELYVIGGVGFIVGVITTTTQKTTEQICALPIKPIKHFSKDMLINGQLATLIADSGGNLYFSGATITANVEVRIAECIGRMK